MPGCHLSSVVTALRVYARSVAVLSIQPRVWTCSGPLEVVHRFALSLSRWRVVLALIFHSSALIHVFCGGISGLRQLTKLSLVLLQRDLPCHGVLLRALQRRLFSALPASSVLAVPSARDGVAPVGSGAPFRSRATVPKDSILLAMAFVTAHASQRWSRSPGLPRRAGGLTRP